MATAEIGEINRKRYREITEHIFTEHRDTFSNKGNLWSIYLNELKENMKTVVVSYESHPCPKCDECMERRTHKSTANITKAYYFSEWDYCPDCCHVQHYEKYKIINENKRKT